MSQPNPSPAIACLLVTHLPVKAERSRFPALRDRPLVIVEPCAYGDRVLDCSPEAEGVTPGMPLADALDSCSSAVVMQVDASHYADVDDRIAGAVRSRFGAVERDGPGRFCVSFEAAPDGAGAPLFGEAQLTASLLQAAPPGFGARVGVAPTRFAAFAVAASARDGAAARAPVDVRRFLRTCSVDLLPLPADRRLHLRRHGIEVLGALADLPLREAQAILGRDATRIVDLSRGIDRDLSPGAAKAAA